MVIIGIISVYNLNQKPDSVALENRFYIWNQLWGKELNESIDFWSHKTKKFHVLTATYREKKWKNIAIDWGKMSKFDELTLVFRINGTRLPDLLSVLNIIENVLEKIPKSQKVKIEIDYDSPTSKLLKYSKWLTEIKKSSQLELGITAIPTWEYSKDLPKLLDKLDYYVLQVHSVLSPEQGLFDDKLAIKWIKEFNQISSTAFIIALPNYWYLANLDNNDKLLFLQAEEHSTFGSKQRKEIFADPNNISLLINKVNQSRFKNLTGWIWFRLPTSLDKRIFSKQTIELLIDNDFDWKSSSVNLIKTPINDSKNNFDFWLDNDSIVDVIAQTHWSIDKDCKLKHHIENTQYNEEENTFILNHQQVFKPNKKQRIGWGVCQ